MAYSKPMIQEYIRGREVTCGVLDDGCENAIALQPKEIIPLQRTFFDFHSKYTAGMTEYICPAEISSEMEKVCRDLAVDVYDAVGCSGAARIDMIIDEEGPQAIEINTIPGMTETSLLPKAAAYEGMSFEELVEKLLDGASLKG